MDQNAKSQAIEQIKKAQNVLVTVSNDPSVDQLAAAIGFTLLLNKLNKHATAVFSGQVPSTLEFLKPEETLEDNTNSLRDFIVSLDKNKADKLRYKVEDEVVRIYITPYRTSLSEQDLSFSQGDFNVDVVVALGVVEQDHLDGAIVEHGRILHDATVISVVAGEMAGDIGGISWQDKNASSLCEMLMGISESLKSGIIDEQIATALLTGIVAETERFSNGKTTPKAMTMSAQLMSAGANQQLVSESLDTPEPEPAADQLSDVEEPNLNDTNDQDNPEQQETEEDGVLNLHHERDNLPKVEEPEIEDHHIGIDDTGAFNNADELRRAVDDVQQGSQGSFKGKTIEPPVGDTFEEKLPYLDEVPSYSGGVVTNAPASAIDDAEPELPSVDQIYDQQPEQMPENNALPPEPSLQRGNAYVSPESLPKAHGEDNISDDDARAVLDQNKFNDAPLPEIKPDHNRKEFLDHPPSTEPAVDEFGNVIEEKPSYSKYLPERPEDAPRLNSVEMGAEETIDPLSSIPSSGPMAEDPNKSTESPLLSTQHDAESVPAVSVPSTENPRLYDDGLSKKGGPLGPRVDSKESLEQIEDDVMKFEGKNSLHDSKLEEARAAVENVAENVELPPEFEMPAYEPLSGENPLPPVMPQEPIDENGPPPMPPPLTPPGMPS